MFLNVFSLSAVFVDCVPRNVCGCFGSILAKNVLHYACQPQIQVILRLFELHFALSNGVALKM